MFPTGWRNCTYNQILAVFYLLYFSFHSTYSALDFFSYDKTINRFLKLSQLTILSPFIPKKSERCSSAFTLLFKIIVGLFF